MRRYAPEDNQQQQAQSQHVVLPQQSSQPQHVPQPQLQELDQVVESLQSLFTSRQVKQVAAIVDAEILYLIHEIPGPTWTEEIESHPAWEWELDGKPFTAKNPKPAQVRQMFVGALSLYSANFQCGGYVSSPPF